MKFLADENISREIVDKLRQEGHFVDYIIELNRGVPDEEILEKAKREGSILITSDRDFGEMVFRLGKASFGVILIRLFGLSQFAKANIIAEGIKNHSKELQDNFTVFLPGRIRIRKRV